MLGNDLDIYSGAGVRRASGKLLPLLNVGSGRERDLETSPALLYYETQNVTFEGSGRMVTLCKERDHRLPWWFRW